jgi:glutaconate CoA-transferase subunit A
VTRGGRAAVELNDVQESIARSVRDGATVAIGGAGLSRKPMTLVESLASSGARDLVIVSFLGSVDVELLLASGCVAELHTAGVDLGGFGLAPAYRTARQDGTVRTIEWSEGSLMAALEAEGRGLRSMPTPTSPRSEIVTANPWLGVHPDPMDGTDVVFARALPLDLALLHVPSADSSGNLHIDGDVGVDGLMARAATRTLSTAERLGDDEPSRASISRLWVDEIHITPEGSWPTACHPASLVDVGAIMRWAGSDGLDASLLVHAHD